jgi:hypothetical protein
MKGVSSTNLGDSLKGQTDGSFMFNQQGVKGPLKQEIGQKLSSAQSLLLVPFLLLW